MRERQAGGFLWPQKLVTLFWKGQTSRSGSSSAFFCCTSTSKLVSPPPPQASKGASHPRASRIQPKKAQQALRILDYMATNPLACRLHANLPLPPLHPKRRKKKKKLRPQIPGVPTAKRPQKLRARTPVEISPPPPLLPEPLRRRGRGAVGALRRRGGRGEGGLLRGLEPRVARWRRPDPKNLGDTKTGKKPTKRGDVPKKRWKTKGVWYTDGRDRELALLNFAYPGFDRGSGELLETNE